MKCTGLLVPSLKPCEKQGVTTRKNWRFGDTKKGEPLIVPVTLNLCRACARAYDENQDEARAEAAGS